MRLGETQLYFAKPCGRCVITTLDPTTANKGKEPLRTLASYRPGPEGPLFGVNLLHEGCGEVEVGMPLQVLE
ncbi:MAG: MOSC domain-containing protein [Myxococcota bacterium]